MLCFVCLALILYLFHVLHGAPSTSICVQHHRASVLTFCHAAGKSPDYLFCHLLLMVFQNSWLLPCNNLWTACRLSCIALSTACLTRIQAAAAFPIHGFCLALLWTACRLSCIAFSTACPTIAFNTLWCFYFSLHAGPAAKQRCKFCLGQPQENAPCISLLLFQMQILLWAYPGENPPCISLLYIAFSTSAPPLPAPCGTLEPPPSAGPAAEQRCKFCLGQLQENAPCISLLLFQMLILLWVDPFAEYTLHLFTVLAILIPPDPCPLCSHLALLFCCGGHLL